MTNILETLIDLINKNLNKLDVNLKMKKESIFIGPGSDLESIVIVSILASIEEELNLIYSIDTDLFEIINNFEFDNITIENIATELTKYHGI